ncbi:MAG: exosome 3'-_5 exonuclease subunit ski4 (Csl4) [Phylliscum demangeonii]|nr:MAG: exosome 3'->5 exonuclease subunit ski4 (Csl4) [Phylliscum demangeonii]
MTLPAPARGPATTTSTPPTPTTTTAIALPGQRLGRATRHQRPGPGTHQYQASICASTAGRPLTTLTTLSISTSPTTSPTTRTTTTTNQLPSVGSTVLARVTRINPRQATVSILALLGDSDNAAVCAHEFPGVIRAQDVRATEKDSVRIFASFRPGDVVRADVVSALLSSDGAWA